MPGENTMQQNLEALGLCAPGRTAPPPEDTSLQATWHWPPGTSDGPSSLTSLGEGKLPALPGRGLYSAALGVTGPGLPSRFTNLVTGENFMRDEGGRQEDGGRALRASEGSAKAARARPRSTTTRETSREGA